VGFVLRGNGLCLRDPEAFPPENLKTVISGSLANLTFEVDTVPWGLSGKMTPPVKCVSGF
jgi:hypothetical protein